MPVTYAQVIEYSRTDAGRALLARVTDCFPDDPALGMTWEQIGAASTAIGYPTSWPALAVGYYGLSGQNLWPNCGAAGTGNPPPGTGAPAPINGPPTSTGLGLDSNTLLLIGGGLLLVMVVKRVIDG